MLKRRFADLRYTMAPRDWEGRGGNLGFSGGKGGGAPATTEGRSHNDFHCYILCINTVFFGTIYSCACRVVPDISKNIFIEQQLNLELAKH